MKKVRTSRNHPVTVDPCPACGAVHAFDLTAIVEEMVDVMHLVLPQYVTRTCSLTCPAKNVPIVIDTTVVLMGGTLLSLR